MIEAEVAVVGGGPAGSLVAAGLAARGHDVVLLERSAAYRWRASGVFSSPATLAALRRAGVPDALLAQTARPIPAMRVETPGGVAFRLAYGGERDPASHPVGFDRSRLDPGLLARAAESGVRVCRGTAVESVRLEPDGATLATRGPDGDPQPVRAWLVVGADGGRSVVARAAGVARPARLTPRVGLTFHVADRPGDPPADARMRVFADGYAGIAPVPGGRVNVGIVLGGRWLPRLARQGAEAVAGEVLAGIPVLDGAAGSPPDPAVWRTGARLDRIAGAAPLGHRVTRRSGERWLLAGDATGFLDPFTGEGLHRAVVSAGLAVEAVSAAIRGRPAALAAYDRAMRRRFASKDAVSWLVQLFLGRPALFEYAARRVEGRTAVRETMGLVMGDLVPASRALDPRFLAALLRP